MKQRDEETRERVLRAAAQLFADRGFKKVTVRDICRAARANVAAVNYYFGDKSGLYREVLQRAIDTVRATSEAARVAGEGQPAEERLRRYIHVSLCRVVTDGHANWISRLIQREIADPTPAFDALVDQGIRPRIDDLSAIVADLLGCQPGDEGVARCVMSIHSQWILFATRPIATRLRTKFHLRNDSLDRVAEHITNFSLAGIQAMARRSG
jgi:AcrR family transcriptional regulator